jgi:hypothetical protein
MASEGKAFLAFLRHFGEDVPAPRTVGGVVTERKVFKAKLGPSGTQAFFPCDREPLPRAEEKKLLRWLGHSRSLLDSLLKGLPEEAWTWKKEGHKGKPLGKRGGGWTIEAYLRHIGNAEKWYLSNFWKGLPRLPRALNSKERIIVVRNQFRKCFAKTTAEDRTRFTVEWGERWSLRKVLRRALYHERCHMRGIAKLLMQNHWSLEKWQKSALF